MISLLKLPTSASTTHGQGKYQHAERCTINPYRRAISCSIINGNVTAMPVSKSANFSIGQLIQHRLFEYRGASLMSTRISRDRTTGMTQSPDPVRRKKHRGITFWSMALKCAPTSPSATSKPIFPDSPLAMPTSTTISQA